MSDGREERKEQEERRKWEEKRKDRDDDKDRDWERDGEREPRDSRAVESLNAAVQAESVRRKRRSIRPSVRKPIAANRAAPKLFGCCCCRGRWVWVLSVDRSKSRRPVASASAAQDAGLQCEVGSRCL